ncbi:MAG: Uma2 family endonuclease [Gemmataceae bacterium]
MNGVLILDPLKASEFAARRAAEGNDHWDEVWNGRLVVPPLPNNEHQQIQFLLGAPFLEAVIGPGLGQVFAGVNISDRATGWDQNYRGPDLVVYLATNPAVNHGTHWQGGPDFLVEIISPGEKPRAKFGFYESVSTREVLIVHRDPWYLELFGLVGGKLVSAGRSDLANPQLLTSGVVPLTFRLSPGTDRPRIEVTHPPTGRTWSA